MRISEDLSKLKSLSGLKNFLKECDASSWKITNVETYGEACFSSGYDCGYVS